MLIGDGKDIFDKFKKEVNDKINSLNTNAENKRKEAAEARKDGNERKAARKERRASSISNRASEYSAVATELNALESSDQVYNLYANNSDVSARAAGSTSYNPATGAIDIKIKGGYNSNFISHELKHAFQFESGALSFKSNGSIGDLYDLVDEQEAFARGRLFGETRTPTLDDLARDYPAIKDNKTQRTLNSKAPFSDKTYREIFQMRAASRGGKGLSIKDVFKIISK